ncbi:hypothetical protein LL1119B1_06260 [Lactococcus lactis]|nr:hypothetical protein LL1119B1_06260 [Lactococcus lactis]
MLAPKFGVAALTFNVMQSANTENINNKATIIFDIVFFIFLFLFNLYTFIRKTIIFPININLKMVLLLTLDKRILDFVLIVIFLK